MGQNDGRDSLYPAHSRIAVAMQARAPEPMDIVCTPCDRCYGRGRIADDWCRQCVGRGYISTGPTPALLELADAISAAAAELTELRVACAKALAALRGVMPYFARLPPESEQYVRKAVKALLEVARG